MSLTIAQMRLAPNARHGAEWVKARYPDLVFTSGRRDPLDQSRVMAENIVKYGRPWLLKTYKQSPIIDTLADWLTQNPTKVDAKTIAHGFYDCLLACHSGNLTKLSKHLTGDAWDAVWPGDEEGERICADLRTNMPVEYFLEKIIDREGGLRIIHAQFAPSVEV